MGGRLGHMSLILSREADALSTTLFTALPPILVSLLRVRTAHGVGNMKEVQRGVLKVYFHQAGVNLCCI